MYKFALRWYRYLLVCVAGFVLASCSGFERKGAATSASAGEARISKTPRTALDDYVTAPDTNYNFHLIKSVPGNDQTTFILEMTSQSWLTTNEVDRPLWKHWVIIVKPNTVTSSKSFLF